MENIYYKKLSMKLNFFSIIYFTAFFIIRCEEKSLKDLEKKGKVGVLGGGILT